ncbi:MAG: hypothetical protein H0V16_12840 [Burkholderiaceae bacterium]|nr:hypothetical protein [Burkholderiaceae bacterium]
MSEESLPPGRGGQWYQVTVLRKGVDARAASFSDFKIVRVLAPNPTSAMLIAREMFNAQTAFDPMRLP